MDEVTKAEEYLKRVESKWKVIDVDLDDDDEKLDGANKDNSKGGSTNKYLSSSNDTRRSSGSSVLVRLVLIMLDKEVLVQRG